MDRLIGSPGWLLLVGIAVLVFGTLAVARVVVGRLFPGDQIEEASALAGTLMAAFGALFAFLSAFLITNEWTQHNAAETAIANEAAASARLAWSADTPGVDRARVVAVVDAYLTATVHDDWPAMADGRLDPLPSDAPYRDLQTTVRAQATASGVESPSATEMLNALDGLAQGRRDRLVAAERVMPAAIYGVVVVSGLALVVNTVIVARSRPWRTGRIVGSIALVVTLDLALILLISGPFKGSYVAGSRPLQRVDAQVEQGWFGPR